MMLEVGDKCVLMTDSWESITHYKVVEIHHDRVGLRRFDDHMNLEAVRNLPRPDADTQIERTPYSRRVAQANPKTHAAAVWIENLTSSWIRTKSQYPVEDLIDQLAADKRLTKIPRRFIEVCLRSRVASEFFDVRFDGRKKGEKRIYSLALSARMVELERSRMFAGSLASELDALSLRVRNLVSHTGTVGTYRENLLQSLLRKNLPERYHVATGFIEGCPRQLDVLIYDRLEYAPLFREQDLVVVPQESARAVIEVKTTLTKAALKESLQLLDEVADYDDLSPPFFRGIFGFESPISAKDIYDTITDFHDADAEFSDETAIITEPFRHFSAVCVLNKACARVAYERTDGKFRPMLVNAESATDLAPQAALFMQHLLEYLRFGGLKAAGSDHLERMLGADTQWTAIRSLVSDYGWGAYFQRDIMDGDDDAVGAMEQTINDVQGWLAGHSWKPSVSQ